MAHRSPPPRIGVLLGKRPTAATLFPELFARLDDAAVSHHLVLPHEAPDRTSLAGLGIHPAQVDLVVHRGLDDGALSLVDELVAAGVDCVNEPADVRSAGDQEVVRRRLHGAGVPVPRRVTARTWEAVRDAAAAAPGRVVVKRQRPGTGRGAEVRSGTAAQLPGHPPFDGPYVVEEFIANDGMDRKLYVVGDQLRGLLKRSPLSSGHTTEGVPFTPDAATADVALRAARAVRLPLCGVDVLPGVDGPVVIDINPFPGYRGVAGAAALIADYLQRRVRGALEQSGRTHR